MPTMLVVDDERGIRAMIRDMLRDEGYAVLAARNGQEALAYLRVVIIDGILCDVMMPGMGGVAFAAALRAEPGYGHIPLLLMSAAHGQPIVPAAWLSGFIHKPFTITALLETVAQALVPPAAAADGSA